MDDLERKNDSDLISDLIAAEEEDAIARFRDSHFEDRLRSRIRKDLARAPRPRAFRAVLKPAWISAVVLVVLGSAVLIVLRSRPPAPQSVITVESALRLLPGIQALEKQETGGLDMVSSSNSALDQSIAAILSTRVMQDGRYPVRDQPPAAGSFDPQKKPLNLQELYDLLIMNRSVERVLTLVSSKPKEG